MLGWSGVVGGTEAETEDKADSLSGPVLGTMGELINGKNTWLRARSIIDVVCAGLRLTLSVVSAHYDSILEVVGS